MLFAGQYHGRFVYQYDRSISSAGRNPERILLQHSSRYGLSSKINIGGLISYNWANLGNGSARLNSQVDISWRSYDYEPGSGPGWLNDSPLDIQYGPIKRPGHVFASLSIGLPRWRNNNGPDFLSFGGLRNDRNWSVSSTIVAGLPRQTEIRATSTLSLNHNASDRHLFRIAVAKRILNKLELSIDYFNDPPSMFARAAGLPDDFEITFNLRGLL